MANPLLAIDTDLSSDQDENLVYPTFRLPVKNRSIINTITLTNSPLDQQGVLSNSKSSPYDKPRQPETFHNSRSPRNTSAQSTNQNPHNLRPPRDPRHHYPNRNVEENPNTFQNKLSSSRVAPNLRKFDNQPQFFNNDSIEDDNQHVGHRQFRSKSPNPHSGYRETHHDENSHSNKYNIPVISTSKSKYLPKNELDLKTLNEEANRSPRHIPHVSSETLHNNKHHDSLDDPQKQHSSRHSPRHISSEDNLLPSPHHRMKSEVDQTQSPRSSRNVYNDEQHHSPRFNLINSNGERIQSPRKNSNPYNEERSQSPRNHSREERSQSPRNHSREERSHSPRVNFKEEQLHSPRNSLREERPQSPRNHYRDERPQSPRNSLREERPQSPRNSLREERPQSPRNHYREDRPQSPRKNYKEESLNSPRGNQVNFTEENLKASRSNRINYTNDSTKTHRYNNEGYEGEFIHSSIPNKHHSTENQPKSARINGIDYQEESHKFSRQNRINYGEKSVKSARQSRPSFEEQESKTSRQNLSNNDEMIYSARQYSPGSKLIQESQNVSHKSRHHHTMINEDSHNRTSASHRQKSVDPNQIKTTLNPLSNEYRPKQTPKNHSNAVLLYETGPPTKKIPSLQEPIGNNPILDVNSMREKQNSRSPYPIRPNLLSNPNPKIIRESSGSSVSSEIKVIQPNPSLNQNIIDNKTPAINKQKPNALMQLPPVLFPSNQNISQKNVQPVTLKPVEVPFQTNQNFFNGKEPNTPRQTPLDGDEKKSNDDQNHPDIHPLETTNLPTEVISSLHTYTLNKTKSSSVFGPTFTYYFQQQNDILFVAKTKSRYPNHPVPIDYGSDIHLSVPNHNFYLVGNQDLSTFTLKEKSMNGKALCNVIFTSYGRMNGKPRTTDITILSGPQLMTLISRSPTFSTTGVYVLDFHHRLTIPSYKNASLMIRGDPQAHDAISIRKIKQNTLEIDVFVEITNVIVFAIALAISLTKVT